MQGTNLAIVGMCLPIPLNSVYISVQDRLCEDIDEAMEKTNDKITYEILEDIPYLDWIIKESMRYLIKYLLYNMLTIKVSWTSFKEICYTLSYC